VDRKDLQQLSTVRLKEARALLGLGLWDGAYYLAGYGVECALKACIAKRTLRYEFPDKKRVIQSYSHDLLSLAQQADLGDGFRERSRREAEFGENWEIAQSWTEESRYQRHSRESAEEMFEAAAHKVYGVIPWIKAHW
jgi:HEPN domain-containing protein